MLHKMVLKAQSGNRFFLSPQLSSPCHDKESWCLQPRCTCSGVCHRWEAGTDPQIAPCRLYHGQRESSRAAGEQLTPKLTLVLPRRNTGQVLVLMLRGEEAGWVPVLGR